MNAVTMYNVFAFICAARSVRKKQDVRKKNKKSSSNHLHMEITRCILPDIVAYFKSERGQRKFAEWKTQQEAEKKEKSEVA